MTASKASTLFAARSTFTPLLAIVLVGGSVACGGGDSGEGSGGSSGTSGSGGSSASGGSSGVGGSGSGNGGSAGSTGGSSGTSGTGEPSGEVCPNERRAGSLSLRMTNDRTIVDGSISDGIAPAGVYREISSAGSCQLLGPRDLFCATPCGSGTTCAGDDMCVPTPMKQSAGAITLTGLEEPLEVMANGITGIYSDTILDPYPLFEAGAAIELSAAGDVFAPFTLRGWGVPPLVTSLSTANVVSGSAVPLTWDTAGVNSEQSEIFISFSVNVHGATTGWIECTAPDTGSFDIPAALVSDLVDLGLSGFPRMTMTRRSADSTDLSTGDCVDFEVGSQVTIELTVDGLVSCNEDSECPEGQMCTPELSCE
jgi:hypothetical protein